MRPPLSLFFSFPKSMQVAVSISSNDIITGSQCKNRDRISPWFQFLSLIAFLGFQEIHSI